MSIWLKSNTGEPTRMEMPISSSRQASSDWLRPRVLRWESAAGMITRVLVEAVALARLGSEAIMRARSEALAWLKSMPWYRLDGPG